jgi:hypothetical protein
MLWRSAAKTPRNLPAVPLAHSALILGQLHLGWQKRHPSSTAGHVPMYSRYFGLL